MHQNQSQTRGISSPNAADRVASRAEREGTDSFVGDEACDRSASSAEHALAEQLIGVRGERVARVELAALIRPAQRVWGEPERSALSVFL
jgi:hypothetical protein